MRSHVFVLMVIANSMLSGASHAAEYVPIAPPKTKIEKVDALKSLRLLSSVQQFNAGPEAADPFTCTSPPTIGSLTTSIISTSMSATMALSLGLPVANLSGNANAKVLVQDWTRSKPCLAADGKTKLIYGQGIRVIATIADIDAKGDLTLPMIAAQATLGNKSSNIQAVVIGIPDQAVQLEAAKLLGPLTVENFGDKSKIVQSLAEKAITGTTGTSEFIGIMQSRPDIGAQVAGAFAIQQVSDRKTCMEAKSKFPGVEQTQIVAIESTYVAITGVCNASQPTEAHKAVAKEALGGVKIKL